VLERVCGTLLFLSVFVSPQMKALRVFLSLRSSCFLWGTHRVGWAQKIPKPKVIAFSADLGLVRLPGRPLDRSVVLDQVQPGFPAVW
jgi:hypothetical protein